MAANRFDVVNSVARSFPELFRDARFNTHDNCARFLWDVCNRLGAEFPEERWGLLSKSPGENGYNWSNGVRTSHDVICLPNGERIDIIADATHESKPATPAWIVIPPNEWRPHNVWIDYNSVSKTGTSNGPPPPPNNQPPSNNQPPVEDGFSKAFRMIEENNRFLRKVAGLWNIQFP